jgi:hypothetical protein
MDRGPRLLGRLSIAFVALLAAVLPRMGPGPLAGVITKAKRQQRVAAEGEDEDEGQGSGRTRCHA